MKIPECVGCGACCAFSSNWVGVTEEERKKLPEYAVVKSDAHYDWDPLPRPDYVMRTVAGNRLVSTPAERGQPPALGQRCWCLVGEIGSDVRCSVYENRPQECRAFERGSQGCLWLLGWYGLGRPW